MQEAEADAAPFLRSALGHACDRDTLTRHLNDYLDIRRFKDAAYNGLQVSGKSTVSYVVAGVTANKALIDAAIGVGADAILVHHGLFWKGDDPRLVGYHRERVASLL
ncbi:MAG TPA: Nif3-like dinuclear metal center hexameric protein, partial [Casimicrobium sp.]|nr:Nif3-like dinuclear metal center hexameric protein [Casimicrobium sp.]